MLYLIHASTEQDLSNIVQVLSSRSIRHVVVKKTIVYNEAVADFNTLYTVITNLPSWMDEWFNLQC